MNLIVDFLKKNWLIAILCVALVFSIGAAVHYYNKAQLPVQVAQAKKILQHPQVKPVDTFRDVEGIEHAEIPVNTNVIKQAALKDSDVVRDSLIRKIDADISNADPSRLLEVTQENIQLRAAVLKLRQDSVNNAYLLYHDNTFSFLYDTRDSTIRNLMLDLQLTQVKVNKKKLFGSSPVIDFYADDKRVSFGGFNHFSVAVPPPTFGLTADAKAAYYFASGRMTPSIGLNARIKNYFVEGRYYWSWLHQSFEPVLGFGYRQTIF